MTAEELRLHVFYSGWASRKLLDAALTLSEEEQRREFGVSHKSLLGTLEHIFFADRIWFARTVDPRVHQGRLRRLFSRRNAGHRMAQTSEALGRLGVGATPIRTSSATSNIRI